MVDGGKDQHLKTDYCLSYVTQHMLRRSSYVLKSFDETVSVLSYRRFARQ